MLPFARMVKYGNKVPVSSVQTIYMPTGNGNGACMFVLYKDNTLYGIGGGTSSNYCFGKGSGTVNYPTWELVYSNVKRFACSLVEFALIQTQDNKFYYSGYNDFNAGTGFASTYTEITNLFTATFTTAQIDSIVDIQVAWSQIFVLLENGDLYGMGSNTSGPLGTGNNSRVTAFTRITTNVKKVINRIQTMWLIKNDNTLWYAGQNSSGIFGAQTPSNAYSLTQYVLGVNVIAEDIAMNSAGSYILAYNTSSGSRYIIVSGNTINGNLGNGSLSNSTVYKVNVLSLGDSKTIGPESALFTNADGSDMGCILYTNTNLYGTGTNTAGRLGTGNVTTAARFTPAVNAPNIGSTETFVASDHGTAYLTRAGDVYYAGRLFASPFSAQSTYTLFQLPK